MGEHAFHGGRSSHLLLQIVDRRWPSSEWRLAANTATFTQNSRRVTSTGGFDELEAGWTISPINAGRIGKWYRIDEILGDTELVLVDHYQETGATVNWTAEADDRAGWTDRTRIVSTVGESAAFVAGSAIVTGTATTWDTVDADDRLFAGMRIGPNLALKEADALAENFGFWGAISSVDSDTQVTLENVAPRAWSSGYRAEWDDPDFLNVAIEVPRGAQFQKLEGGGFVLSAQSWGPISEGTITLVNGSTTVTGVGTSWTSDVEAGDLISPTGPEGDDGSAVYMVVDSVTDNTHLEMKVAWDLAGVAGNAFTIIRPLYGDNVGLNGLSTLLLSTKAVEESEKALAAGVEVTTRIVPNQ